MELNIGDIVARKSYNSDILFKIEQIRTTESGNPMATLRALDVRLIADSPLSDLVKVENQKIRQYRQEFIKVNNQSLRKIMSRRTKNSSQQNFRADEDFFDIPGRVLHLDGSLEYLKLCTEMYKQMGIRSKGLHIKENEQPVSVPELLRKYKPDILVLTGHDGIIKSRDSFSDIKNYHNSAFFVQSVKAARDFENNKDELIIFAGACQSHYEAILEAGANFASSPLRVFIHAFDPVFIVEKVAFTGIKDTVSINEVVESTITGTDGLGGIETRGKYRKGYPRSPY